MQIKNSSAVFRLSLYFIRVQWHGHKILKAYFNINHKSVADSVTPLTPTKLPRTQQEQKKMIFQVAQNINHADKICIISFHDVRWQSIESDSVPSIDFSCWSLSFSVIYNKHPKPLLN